MIDLCPTYCAKQMWPFDLRISLILITQSYPPVNHKFESKLENAAHLTPVLCARIKFGNKFTSTILNESLRVVNLKCSFRILSFGICPFTWRS